ncbi:MAG: Mrp/NBP35 family ATP-binding protein [Chloroflexota bacterium]|nr:Mrp/NBP35 family ATP-binding protein [Chloroflexota bacterium]
MLTKEQVVQALEKVLDPEIGRSIVELGMVREVEIVDSRVKVVIALTIPNCPLKGVIAKDAEEHVAALADGLDVQIELSTMTEAEKQRMTETLHGQSGGGSQEQGPLTGKLNHIQAVVAVMSGKGGVGKSTTAALLAAGLRHNGLRVGVLDADVTGPSIPKLFGVDAAPVMGPLGIVPPQSEQGIKIMSINLMLERKDEAVIWRGPLISSAIKQFWGDVFWGDLDVLVVDLPPGTSDAALTVMQSLPVDGVVIVTSPQDLADMVVRKAAHMAGHMKVGIWGIVENMSYVVCPHCGERYSLFGAGNAADMAQTFKTELLAQIPIDPELSRLCDAGQVERYESVEFEGALVSLSARLKDVAAKGGSKHRKTGKDVEFFL